jgi:ribosomal protein L11 methyltransferase
VTQFPPGADVDAVRDAVLAADPDAEITIGPASPVDWTEGWKTLLRAHDLGALSIVPPWLADGRDPARTVVIDPGMAFGTGDHPTTRGVVRLLAPEGGAPLVRPGDVVADLGAGSAVLAIAAAKLGAARVAAIEYDADAIENAEENVRRNGVADRVTVIEGDAHVLLPLVAPVRLVLANIISSVLTELLPAVGAALAPAARRSSAASCGRSASTCSASSPRTAGAPPPRTTRARGGASTWCVRDRRVTRAGAAA